MRRNHYRSMLNRRHLRIKIFQAIYSYLRGAKNDLPAGERELMNSVNRIHELFVLHVSVFSELERFANKRMEERKSKKLPSKEDLNPNLKFIENPLVAAMAKSESLQKKIEEYKISWADHQDVILKLYKEIESSDMYERYMNNKKNDLDSHRNFVLKVYREFIADNEIIQDVFEERSIHWSDDHYFVCGYVVKFLKNYQERFEDNYKIPALLKDVDDDIDFVKKVYRQTLLHNDEYQAIIMEKAKNWEADRIAIVDFILMKMAVCELIKLPSVPIKVTLNEYIELSKAYSTPKSKMFINGILDKLVPELKESGDIVKTGRGLMN